MAAIRSIINPMRPRMSALQLLLLVQLEASPKYGYEMLKAIKEDFKGVWDLKTGTLYPALKSLEKHGFVATEKKDNVDFYNLTDNGKKLLSTIALHQEAMSKFSDRFLSSITKHMSPVLKKNILDSIVNLSKYDVDWTKAALILMDGFDTESKLVLLRSMKANISKRLTSVNEIIAELEETRG